MKLTLLALTYFQKTAELQHLTHAAEALHIPSRLCPTPLNAGTGVGRPPVSPIRKKHRPHQVRRNPSQPYKQDYERT